MSVGKALAQHLLTDIDFIAKVGTRLYPIEAPPNSKLAPGKPSVVYRGREEDVRDLTGPTGQKMAEVVYDITGLTYLDCQEAALKIRAAFSKPALAGVKGPGMLVTPAGSFRIQIMKLGPEDDQFTGPKFQDEMGIYRTEVELEVWYEPGPRP